MVLIFSKVQRCCINGAPKGFYGYNEQFDVPPQLAEQLVAANVAGYVIAPAPEPAPVPVQPEPQPEPAPAPVKGEVPDEPMQTPAPVKVNLPKKKR